MNISMRKIFRHSAPGLLLIWVLSFSHAVMAQPARISEWVENAPASDNTNIALGYPVPIPVDTPLPFDGFRSYSGLHARHQDLAVTTSWVHPVEVGNTRSGRTIWMYQLGDADKETVRGLPEHAMLTNGGIHAREWQSPEVATGIIELLALNPDDDPLIDYLRENANMMVIPVMNIDGFLQTQRYPSTNWMGTDPNDPEGSPRDGRMRRKNMLGADESLNTQGDHLMGVDLNRNSPPFWATNPQRSSGDPESIVHHGAAPQSEPEIQILDTAAQFGPDHKLNMFSDMHSYSQVLYWGSTGTGNGRLAGLTRSLLTDFSGYHRGFDAAKNYGVDQLTSAFGMTNEYFANAYQALSFGLEIEPSRGAGSDYGGLGRNGHDGFILPESEVERVRTELAQTFAIVYYEQSGPPSITTLRLIDEATDAVVFEAEWDTTGATERLLHSYQVQPLQLDRDYRAWVAWDKPMRVRENGEVAALPGQLQSRLDVDRFLTIGEEPLDATFGDFTWLNEPGGTPSGYQRYHDDAIDFPFSIPASEPNNALINGNAIATLAIDTYDITGTRGDADPATVARWENGGWSGYENSEGVDQTDQGGIDSTLQFEVTSQNLDEPFVVVPDTSAMWYDTSRNGEGFMLEILSETRALMYWFTYDTEGAQDWYFGDGEIRGNRIVFPDVLRVDGGEFGPGFDPEKITRTAVGSASFIFESCDVGMMDYVIDRDGGPRRQGRMNLSRLTRVMGMPCIGPPTPGAPIIEQSVLSGSWYDPSHSGEGFTIEVMFNREVLLFWFSYDAEGNRRWFYGTGQIEGEKIIFDEMFTTSGGVFGPGFDKDKVEVEPWGRMELELECELGIARFEPSEEGFPAGSLDLDRLSLLDGLSCE